MNKNLPKYAIIVAGGSGLRMGSAIPKQFIPINGMPILMHTLTKFKEAIPEINIHLVLPEDQMEYWKSLCIQFHFNLTHRIITGGHSRFQSVKNGLNSIEGDSGIVAIHDGVRPFVSKGIIIKSFEVAETLGNATVAVTSKDSLRVIENNSNKAVDRANYRIIQTPQTFQLGKLKEAFNTPELPIFTDDASVFEYAGNPIHLIEGAFENIKITTPEDLKWAEVFCKAQR